MSGSWASVKIFSKKDRRRRESDVRRKAAPLVGKWVNLALRDGSAISKVYLEPFPGKRLLRYSTAANDIAFVPLAEIDTITTVSLKADQLQGCT